MEQHSQLKNQNPSKVYAFFVFIVVLLQLVCFYPYEFKTMYFPFLPVAVELTAIFLGFTYLLYLFTAKKTRLPYEVIKCMTVQLIGFGLCFLFQGYLSNIITMLLTFALCYFILLYIESSIGLKRFFKLYNHWILLIAALGSLTWFLVNFFGYSPAYSMIDFANEDRILDNYLLTFSGHNDEYGELRYAGFFDEPGAMGQWGIFALLINKLYVKNKWIEFPLIACLFLTMSMGYYLQLVVYLVVFYSSKKHIVRNLIILAMAWWLLSLLASLEGGSFDILYSRTIGRFLDIRNESSSIITADNRENIAQNALNEFWKNPLFGTSRRDIYVGDNIYEPLALYGIVGSFLVYFPFIYMIFQSIKKHNAEVLCALIVIVVGFSNRPYHAHLLYCLVLYSILILSKKDHNKYEYT